MKSTCLLVILVCSIGLNCHGESELLSSIANDDPQRAVEYFESLENISYDEMLNLIDDFCAEIELEYGIECDGGLYKEDFKELFFSIQNQDMCMGGFWGWGEEKRVKNAPEDEWIFSFDLLVGGGEIIVGAVMIFCGAGKTGATITGDGLNRFRNGIKEVSEERERREQDKLRLHSI